MANVWPIPRAVTEVARRLMAQGQEAYLVGGAVRDLILRLTPKDWDLATDARPAKTRKIFPKGIPTGEEFGTITVLSHGVPIQVTSYRKESAYRDARHPSKVRFGVSLEADLARRDFTINAMALHPIRRDLVDPFGGQIDLKRKRLRAVGDPRKRFREDALRIVRAGRFVSQLGFLPDASLSRAARASAPQVRRLAAERIRSELEKILLSPKPSQGLLWLQKSQVLECFLPELSSCVGVTQGGWHTYDVFMHTLRAVDAAEPDLELRLALLLHDIAKPATRFRNRTGIHFYGHDRMGSEMAERVMRRLRFPAATLAGVSALIRHHLFQPEQVAVSDAATRRFLNKVGVQQWKKVLLFRKADVRGCGPRRRVGAALGLMERRIQTILRREDALGLKDLAANGRDIMAWLSLKPGPRVGEVLQALLIEVLRDPRLNTPKGLKLLANSYAKKSPVKSGR